MVRIIEDKSGKPGGSSDQVANGTLNRVFGHGKLRLDRCRVLLESDHCYVQDILDRDRREQ